MVKTGLTTKVDNGAAFREAIELLAATRVMVGVPADKALRDPEDGAPINNAALAYIHEHGAPEANIPARPFLGPGIAQAKSKIVQGLRDAGKLAFAAKPDAVMRQFHKIGAIARDSVKLKITTGPFVPLAPSTIAARKRKRRSRKNTDIKPLIDTGAMRNAINYVLRKIRWRG